MCIQMISDLTCGEEELIRKRSRADQQRLGQFLTPLAIADYLGSVVMMSSPATVLDPAVGTGRLLRSLPTSVKQFGLDMDKRAIEFAKASLDGNVNLQVGDFLEPKTWPFPVESFDAIIANPPYVRHHRLTSRQKAQRRRLNEALGVELSSLSDYYVYFFAEAILRLNDGGRLAFVTPARYLDANYGNALKSLFKREGTVEQVIVFDRAKAVFDNVRVAAAITVVRKGRTRRSTQFRHAIYNGKVDVLATRSVPLTRVGAGRPWQLELPGRSGVASDSADVRLGDLLTIRRGIATGSNRFFCLTEQERRDRRIPESYLRPALGSARGMPLREFTKKDWEARRDAGHRVWLLWCREPIHKIRSMAVLEYLEEGEELGVSVRTICAASGSRPWYAVEDVRPPDFLFTYMSKRPLRFIENKALVRPLTTFLCAWFRSETDRKHVRELLTSDVVAAAVTAAAQDMGAGLCKIEPGSLREVQLGAAARA
jgi:adenine-specific DNA-methyltransferase